MNSGHSPHEIANRMREARKAKNLSQEELGRRLGLTKVAYGDYERVKRLLDTEQLFQLERFLNCSVAWLLGLPIKEGELSADEQLILNIYRRAKEQGRDKLVLDTLKILTREDNA